MAWLFINFVVFLFRFILLFQMSDQIDVVNGIQRLPGVSYPVLVPNLIGFNNAVDFSFFSISVKYLLKKFPYIKRRFCLESLRISNAFGCIHFLELWQLFSCRRMGIECVQPALISKNCTLLLLLESFFFLLFSIFSILYGWIFLDGNWLCKRNRSHNRCFWIFFQVYCIFHLYFTLIFFQLIN